MTDSEMAALDEEEMALEQEEEMARRGANVHVYGDMTMNEV